MRIQQLIKDSFFRYKIFGFIFFDFSSIILLKFDHRKELDLYDNILKKIENIDCLVNLEILDLRKSLEMD